MDEFNNHCKQLALIDLERFFDDWIYTTQGISLVVDSKTYEELIQYYKDK